MPARIRSAHCACWNCRRDRSATEPEPEPFSGHSYRRRAHNRSGDPTPLPQTATSGTPQQVQHSDSPLASHDASAGYLAVRDPDVGGAGGDPTVCPVRDLGEGFRVRHDVRGAGRPDHRVHDRPVLAEFWSIPYLDSRAGQDAWGRLLGEGDARGIALVFLVPRYRWRSGRCARVPTVGSRLRMPRAPENVDSQDLSE